MLKTVLGFNASERTNWNTAKGVQEVLKGAASKGAKTEFIHLSKLNFSGCHGCLGCKKIGPTNGKCVLNDDLTEILQKIKKADAIVLGSPIYFSCESALCRKFIERLFQFYRYGPEKTIFPKKIKSALVYSMNCPKDLAKTIGYENTFENTKRAFEMIFGDKCTVMPFYDTLQIKKYSNYHLEMFDEKHKLQIRSQIFPEQLKEAFSIGQKLIE